MSLDPLGPNRPQAMSDMTSGGSDSHLATVSYDGRLWDVYLDFEDNPSRRNAPRGRLRFAPADGEPSEGVETAAILVEDSDELVVRKAQSLEEHTLVALLRSVLPD